MSPPGGFAPVDAVSKVLFSRRINNDWREDCFTPTLDGEPEDMAAVPTRNQHDR